MKLIMSVGRVLFAHRHYLIQGAVFLIAMLDAFDKPSIAAGGKLRRNPKIKSK